MLRVHRNRGRAEDATFRVSILLFTEYDQAKGCAATTAV